MIICGMYSTVSCVFFFQAEDGIRDIGVTGVQTCALPISRTRCGFGHIGQLITESTVPLSRWWTLTESRRATVVKTSEIGRASCRERVYISVGVVWLHEKVKSLKNC